MILQDIANALEKHIETYYIAVPNDNTNLPISRYYITSETSALVGDSTQFHRRYVITIDIFNNTPDFALEDAIEAEIRSLEHLNPKLQMKVSTKENQNYRTSFDFSFITFN